MTFQIGMGLLMGTALGSSFEAEGMEKLDTNRMESEKYLLSGRLISVLSLAALLTETFTKTHIIGIALLTAGSLLPSLSYFATHNEVEAKERDPYAIMISMAVTVINLSVAIALLNTAVPTVGALQLACGAVPGLLSTATSLMLLVGQFQHLTSPTRSI